MTEPQTLIDLMSDCMSATDLESPTPKRKGGRGYNPAPRPYVKWVGGKRRLLPQLLQLVPPGFDGTYHEPFVGGGALFYALRPSQAHLGDLNLRLARTYRAVRDSVDEVIELLRDMRYEKEFFRAQRRRSIDEETDIQVAAWFIFLNKAGYNGMYRVNKQNIFNVPFGRYVNPTICDAGNLRACSAVLQGVEIHHGDFETELKRAEPGDFVYCDPPYVPLSASSSFVSYTVDGFGDADQIRLRDLAVELKQRGVHVQLSNSSADRVRELYAEGFALTEVQVPRAINSKANGRGKVTELLIS